MEWQNHSGIRYIAKKTPGAKNAVVLFHGYGADATDLAPLSDELKLDRPVDWYFPQGVLEVQTSPVTTGRAWISLAGRDWDALDRGEISDEGLTNEAKAVRNKVVQWTNKTAEGYEQIFVGGFSQGAILTTHCFYQYNFAPSGLIFLSGYLTAPSDFPSLPDTLKAPFFQSHGISDPVLPISGAQKLHEKLLDLGLDGGFCEFKGQHEIPPLVLKEMNSFMRAQLRS